MGRGNVLGYLLCLLLVPGIYGFKKTSCNSGTETFGTRGMGEADNSGEGIEGLQTETTLGLDTDDDSERGYTIECCGTVNEWKIRAQCTDDIALQIWRPVGGDDYMLVGEEVYTPTHRSNWDQTVTFAGDIYVLPYDVMGWTGNCLRAQENGGGSRKYAKYFRRTTLGGPGVGDVETFISTDEVSLRDRANFAIKVEINVDAKPTCSITLPSAARVAQNVATGSSIAQINNNDDIYATYTYSIVAPDNSDIETQANGTIVTKIQIPLSTFPEENYVFKYRVTNQCGTETKTCTTTLTIEFANEPLVLSTPTPDSASIDECETTKQTLDRICTTDYNDNNPVDVPTCLIDGANPGGIFTVTVDSGNDRCYDLAVESPTGFDFDTTPSYTITTKCKDQYDSAYFVYSSFTLSVVDNSAPTASDGAAVTVGVDVQATSSGDTVYTAVLTDAEGQTISHSMAWTGSPPFQYNTGARTITATMNLESIETATYTGTITFNDGCNPDSTLVVTLRMDNINTRPTINNCGTTHTLDENSALDTSVTTMGVTDANLGQPHVFSVIGSAAPFDIDPTSGLITLDLATPVWDYETQLTDITMDINVNDGIHDNTVACTITIQISNVNEGPVLTSIPASTTINEELPTGTTIINTIVATDEDTSRDGDTLTYSIASGDPSGFFLINPSTGVITQNIRCDVDTTCATSHDLTIQVTDAGGAIDTAVATIVVSDINDNTCVFDGSTTYTITCTNLTAIFTTLLTFTITDADSGANGLLTKHIVGTKGRGFQYFFLNGNALQLKAKVAYPDGENYYITVCASDAGTPPLKCCQSVHILYPAYVIIPTPAPVYPPGVGKTPEGVLLLSLLICSMVTIIGVSIWAIYRAVTFYGYQTKLGGNGNGNKGPANGKSGRKVLSKGKRPDVHPQRSQAEINVKKTHQAANTGYLR